MSVESVTNAYSTVVGAADRDYSEVSKIDFMTLLVAQIQNQDPTSPMDNAEFTSQMTQFTMLEQLETLGDKLDENLIIGQSINNTAMLSLVGKEVTVEGDKIWMEDGEASETVLACGAAGEATIEVTDESGNVVATFTEDVVAGLNSVTWDGLLDDGETAPDGTYTIEVTVEDDGEEVEFTTLMTGAVQGLRYDDSVAIVQVDGEEYYVSEIYKVS